MSVVIGDITATTTVLDDATIELSGAWGVHALELGGITYVYVGAEDSNAVTAFELGPDGSLTFIETIEDDATLLLDDASNLTSATVAGTTYLYVNSAVDDGISGFSVAADGTLTNVENVADSATLEINQNNELVGKMSVATVGGNSFLIAPGYADDGVSVFRIEADGSLTSTDDEGGLDGSWDTATATVGGNTFVFVTSSEDDFIGIGSLDGNGELTPLDSVSDDATLELDGVRALTTAVVGGTTFLVAGGYEDDGLSVFSVSDTGGLASAFNLSDSAARGLNGVTSLSTFALDTETFVVASGENDNALGVFHLSADGTLTDVATIFDNAGITLDSTNGSAFASAGGVPILLGTSNTDGGVTSFDIGSGDDTLVGTASADILLGLAGSDLLDGAEGDDLMRGGSGDDTYVVDTAGDVVGEEEGAGRDTVQALIDYALGANLEDLLLLGSADLSGTGNGGDNTATGNGGANLILGKAGKDALFGQGGKDTLEGGNDNDDLFGGKKGDLLFGGKGKDDLTGNQGNDDFVYTKVNQSGTSNGTRDRIFDFGGKDDIVLTDIDAVKGLAGNQDFVLDANGDFQAGEIRLRTVNAGVRVELNVDGDAQAEMSILLKGFVGNLNASDFEF